MNWGSHPVVFRAFSRLCAQGSLIEMFWGSRGLARIESRSATCKAGSLPFEQYLSCPSAEILNNHLVNYLGTGGQFPEFPRFLHDSESLGLIHHHYMVP